MWGKNRTKTEKGGDVGRNGSPFDFQASRNYPSRTFHIPELEQSDRYDAFSLSLSLSPSYPFFQATPTSTRGRGLPRKRMKRFTEKIVEGRGKDATGLRVPKLKEGITGNGEWGRVGGKEG